MSLTAEQRLAMLEHAWEFAPHEVCGVVVRGQVIRISNVASDPENTFEMHHQQLIGVYENYGSLDGVYHSHPGGSSQPSPTDKDAAPRGIPYYIVTMGDVHEHFFALDH